MSNTTIQLNARILGVFTTGIATDQPLKADWTQGALWEEIPFPVSAANDSQWEEA